MVNIYDDTHVVLNQIIKVHLVPLISKIDQDAYYPKEFIKAIGQKGLLLSPKKQMESVRSRDIYIIEETAKYCMTSAFILWCHIAAVTSIRESSNPNLKKDLLPLLESGEIIGGTGLSNALKYYSGFESILLNAVRTEGGYKISGRLPSVSNLGNDHWFVILASLNQNQRIMCIIPVQIKGLQLEVKNNFVGLNGSATYSCLFHDVFVPDKWTITEEADELIKKIRPALALNQIPLGIGVSKASIHALEKRYSRNPEENQFLVSQIKELKDDIQLLCNKIKKYAFSTDLQISWMGIAEARLDIVSLTYRVVHFNMIYSGGQSYIKDSESFRRIRESYFLTHLTPTVQHLEKLRKNGVPKG